MLDRSTQLGRVLVSQDEDLLREGTKRQREGILFAGIIFAPKTGATWGQYIEDLVLIAEVEEMAEYANRIHYLPL